MYRLVIDWGLLEQIIFLPSCLAFLSVLLTSHLQQKKLPGTRSQNSLNIGLPDYNQATTSSISKPFGPEGPRTCTSGSAARPERPAEAATE